MSVFVAFFLPVTLALGLWQISRGAAKAQLETQYVAAQAQLPFAPANDVAQLPPFTRLRIEGRFDPDRYLLIDNQTRAGRVGYAVVGLFAAAGGRVYLVNRGWIAGDARREVLPRVEAPVGRVTITGSIWHDTGLAFGSEANALEGDWPMRVARLDPGALSARITDLVPVEIRLEPGAAGALDVHFPMPQFAPEKHYGYAVQWFLLALALVALYVHYGFRRGDAS